MDRTFSVIVLQKGKPLVYPPMLGPLAETLMDRLAQRGFSPVAETSANGITERLSLDELRWMLDGRQRI